MEEHGFPRSIRLESAGWAVAPVLSLCLEHLTPLPEPSLGPVKEMQMSHTFGVKKYNFKNYTVQSFPLGNVNSSGKSGSKGHLLLLLFIHFIYLFLK